MTHTYNSFIYVWFNTVKRRFYIGKHHGSVNDGYICSSKVMLRDYKRNPEHFKRRIIQYVNDIDGNQILQAELKWLGMVKDSELDSKYYNLKNKNFGNTRGCKKSYVWNQGLTKLEQKEYLELRKNKLFCLLTEKPKKGVIFKPLINYNCAYCDKQFDFKNARVYCSIKCFREDKKKIKKEPKKIIAWNKGLPNPLAAENGKKSASKQAATVTGRKMAIINGKRTWIYPNKEISTTVNS